MVVVEARPAEATFPGNNGKLAFVRDGPLDSHIFTIYPDGSGLAKISTGPLFDSSPAWSPNGKKIVFSSANPAAPNLDVSVMKSDGTEVERLLTKNDASHWEPNWQPLP